MPTFDFPASPVAGDKITNTDAGTTYEYQAEGFWKAIKYDVPVLTPYAFVLRVDGPPPSDAFELGRIFVPEGFTLDLSDADSYVTANPASTLTFDILVNNDRDSDTITVSSAGAVTINDVRGPYIGPVTLSIYYDLGG